LGRYKSLPEEGFGNLYNRFRTAVESTTRLRCTILLVLILLTIVSSLSAVLFLDEDWGGLALNFGTEIAGALVTYWLLGQVLGRREERETRKVNLIAQLGSSREDVAIAAAEELEREGWLYDGSLKRASLWRANLPGAHLDRANMPGASLVRASLQGAYLNAANLLGATLHQANLQGATLVEANLQEAMLVGANLQNTDLSGAILVGANLHEANLLGPTCKRPNSTRTQYFQMAKAGCETPI
jgi:hypothetical protein